jgi:hypothetical protein
MQFVEVLPLPSERRRSLALLLDEVGWHEAWDASPNRPPTAASVAHELAGDNIVRVSGLADEPERIA